MPAGARIIWKLGSNLREQGNEKHLEENIPLPRGIEGQLRATAQKMFPESDVNNPMTALQDILQGSLVPVRIRTWQGSEELARGHRCGWPQGSHWVWDGTPSPVQSDNAVNRHPSRADTYVSNAVSFSCPTWTSPGGAAMTAPPRKGEHSTARLCLLFTVFTVLVVATKPPHRSPCCWLRLPRPLEKWFELDLRYL